MGRGTRRGGSRQAAAGRDARQPTGEADGPQTAERRAAPQPAGDVHRPEAGASGAAGQATPEGARADVCMTEAGPSSADGQATPEGVRADVRMSEAGPSSEAGRATPEGVRADGAATPTRTDDTLHMHSVAGTAKRRQKRKARSTRGHDRVEAALASAVDRELAKRARDAPPSDGLADETEMT